MAISISLLAHTDVEGAIDCIQQAFTHDPYFLWAFPDRDSFSVPRNRSSLRTRCLWGMKYALFHVAKDSSAQDPDKVLAVGCWLPPSLAAPAPSPPTWTQYAWSWLSTSSWGDWTSQQSSSWSLWFNQLTTNIWHGGRGGLSVARYYIWKQAQAQAQEELWNDPAGYYFCNIVAVSPEAQGKGVGKAIMNVVLKQADQEGRKCYLESSRWEPNGIIYGRMGFKLVRDMKCQEGPNDQGITLYCMMRDPVRP